MAERVLKLTNRAPKDSDRNGLVEPDVVRTLFGTGQGALVPAIVMLRVGRVVQDRDGEVDTGEVVFDRIEPITDPADRKEVERLLMATNGARTGALVGVDDGEAGELFRGAGWADDR